LLGLHDQVLPFRVLLAHFLFEIALQPLIFRNHPLHRGLRVVVKILQFGVFLSRGGALVGGERFCERTVFSCLILFLRILITDSLELAMDMIDSILIDFKFGSSRSRPRIIAAEM
jgi:hypothetical protein